MDCLLLPFSELKIYLSLHSCFQTFPGASVARLLQGWYVPAQYFDSPETSITMISFAEIMVERIVINKDNY